MLDMPRDNDRDMRDSVTDSDPDIRWMTYAEAARVLGVNPESVAKRMRRGNWARRLGNDGKPRVGVPVSVLPSVPVSFLPVPVPVSLDDRDNVPDIAADPEPYVPDIKHPSNAKPDMVDPVRVLADRLETETERANRLEAELREVTSRAAAAEGEAIALREAVGYARAQAATDRAARDRAQKELSTQEAQQAVLQARLDSAQRDAELAAKIDASVRQELEVLKAERDTVEKLGFLGRLAWALRRNRG
jgi:hypothetical protein